MGNKGLSEETIETHESYGMVGINRCSSNGTYLFGSIAEHHSFITLEIRSADKRRMLAHDRYSANSTPLIEIEMSHSQFGELITSPGIGNGVPCTIRARDGKLLEGCPPPEKITSKFEKDLKATTKETVHLLQDLTDQLDEALLPGNKPLNKKELGVLLSGIKSAVASVKDSIPFIEDSFKEEMEVQVDKAVTELEGVRAHMFQEIALRAIGASQGGNALPEFRVPMLSEGEEKPK